MNLNRLSRGEQILGGAGLLLFILSFIPPWGNISTSTEVEGVEGVIEDTALADTVGDFNLWGGYGLLPKLGVLVALILAILVVAKAAGALDRANLPIPIGLVYLGGAAITLITMLIAVIAGPEGENSQSTELFGVTSSFEQNRGIFLWVGLLLTLALAAGAYLHFSSADSTSKSGPGTPGGSAGGGTMGPGGTSGGPTTPPGT